MKQLQEADLKGPLFSSLGIEGFRDRAHLRSATEAFLRKAGGFCVSCSPRTQRTAGALWGELAALQTMCSLALLALVPEGRGRSCGKPFLHVGGPVVWKPRGLSLAQGAVRLSLNHGNATLRHSAGRRREAAGHQNGATSSPV